MTILKKPVSRRSSGIIREAGKAREIVITMRPPNLLGFRAAGCRKEYLLTAEACYCMALKAAFYATKRQKAAEKKKLKH